MSGQSTHPPPPAPDLSSRSDRGPGRPPIYPWDEWLDCESAYVVTRGENFTCKVRSFITQLHRAATDRGVYAHYEQFDDDGNQLMIWATRD